MIFIPDMTFDVSFGIAVTDRMTVDSVLSSESEAPLQNKVIYAELEKKQDKGDYALKEDVRAVTKELKGAKEEQNAKNSVTDKRLTNLEKGLPSDRFLTDSESAYIKSVPSAALAYAEVSLIGGATKKSRNILSPSLITSIPAINASLNADGSVTVKNTNNYTLNYEFYLTGKLPAGEYTLSNFSGLPIRIDIVNTADPISVAVGDSASFEYDGEKYLRIFFSGQGAGEEHVIKVMLSHGDAVYPYEPYFDAFRSVKVTEVESVGVNLLNPDWRKSETINGVTFTKNADGSVTANGTATGDVVYHMALNTIGGGDMLEPNTTYYASLGSGFLNTDNKVLAVGTSLNGKISYHIWGNSRIFTTPAEFDGVLVRIRAYAGEVFSNEVLYPIIAKSSVAMPYSPYVKNTLAIPEEMQALDGYGEGVSESVYNYIDLEKKQFIKRIVKVVLNGSEDWVLNGSGNYTYFSHRLGDFNSAVQGEGICDKYENTPISSGTTANGFYVLNSNAQNASVLNVRDLAYTTTAEWKAHLAENPITVYYGLTAPTVTDVSDILPADNFIEVEGNGTLAFKNGYGYAVPSEITYMLKEI